MCGASFILRLLSFALALAPGYPAAVPQESDGEPDDSSRSEAHEDGTTAEGGLRIIGERSSLRLMLEVWAGRLAGRISVAEDGIVIFEATRTEVAGDA